MFVRGPWWKNPGRAVGYLNAVRGRVGMAKFLASYAGKPGCFATQALMNLPGLGSVPLDVVFTRGRPETPRVFSTTTVSSPHRYGDRSLCLWHPQEEPEVDWTRPNGVATLLTLAANHLYLEAFFDATGDWRGEEFPHAEKVAE